MDPSESSDNVARHELDAASTTAEVNRALAEMEVADDSAADAVAASHRLLAALDDAW